MPNTIPTSGMSLQQALPGLGPSLPSAATTPNGSGDEVMDSLIKTLTTPIDPNLVRAATTPIPSSRATNVPSSFMRPIEEPTPGGHIPNPEAGRGSANATGVGNAVIGAMNILGTVVTHEKQAKQDQLRDAATKVINAQQAVDEATRQREAAKQAGDTAGMDAAQKIIDQNEAVRDGVFADPKLRKGLQKGFDISYTDPSSNKTDEHAAVMEAIKNAKTAQEKRQAIQQMRQQQNQQVGKGMGAAYAQQQPQTFQPNVQAIQKLNIEQANRAASQVALKDYLTFKASMARANATLGAAQMRVIGSGILQQARFDEAARRQDQALTNSKIMQDIRFKDALSEISARGAQARQTARDIWSDKESDPIALGQKMQKSIKSYDDAIEKDAEVLAQLQHSRTGLYVDSKGSTLHPETKDVQAADSAIQYAQQHMQNMKASRDSLMKNYDALRNSVGLSGGGTESDSTDNSDTDNSDYSNPLNYMGNSTDDDKNEQP